MPTAYALHTLELEKRIFWSLIAALVAVFCMYVYFINATVMNIVGRQAADREITAVNSKIASLESRYLALSNTITPAYAASLGFIETKGEQYAVRKTFTMAFASSAAN